MNILITGGLGAVGAPLAELLRKLGHKVWVLDRPHHHGWNAGYYFRCDVGEYRQLENVMREEPFDLVYHAAGEFGRINGEHFYESMWKTNAIGTKNMLRLQESKRFRLVMFSSSEIYGDWAGVMTEDVPDRQPIRQLNDYAISKWVNELQIGNSVALHNTETVIVRLFNTYGPGEPYSEYRSVICKFVYCALHDLPYTVYLNHHRTFTYIDDTCQTLANLADRFQPGAVYNIAGVTYIHMRELSDIILRLCGKSDKLVKYIETEPHNTLNKKSSAERAARDLAHRESVNLEEGLRRTIEWQRMYYNVTR